MSRTYIKGSAFSFLEYSLIEEDEMSLFGVCGGGGFLFLYDKMYIKQSYVGRYLREQSLQLGYIEETREREREITYLQVSSSISEKYIYIYKKKGYPSCFLMMTKCSYIYVHMWQEKKQPRRSLCRRGLYGRRSKLCPMKDIY